MQVCLSVKAPFELPPGQTTGMESSLRRLAGPDWPVPDFSTLNRRQKTIIVAVSSRRALHRDQSGSLALPHDTRENTAEHVLTQRCRKRVREEWSGCASCRA